jgi:Gluconate 2-dehydrogenase subunit 3
LSEVGMHQMGRASRREVLQRLIAGIAAGLASPLFATSHPIYRHLVGDDTNLNLERAEQMREATEWTPLFLSPEQNRAFVVVAEAIVPGATAANVSRFVDLLLSVETSEHEKEFLASLMAIENAARNQYGNGFAALNPNEREAVLSDASQHEALRAHFENLKEWVVGAYYSSEQGMRELGWNGNVAFEGFPGCEHEDSRP